METSLNQSTNATADIKARNGFVAASILRSGQTNMQPQKRHQHLIVPAVTLPPCVLPDRVAIISRGWSYNPLPPARSMEVTLTLSFQEGKNNDKFDHSEAAEATSSHLKAGYGYEYCRGSGRF
ncbi:hypothetical protein PIB30_022328 [Stylosanthes scabra]|uniref:Uncharacterized protein n=1 Tax=Stylosanthes scabra TaxID=79078 RepID=A0ABU6V9C2_9FABA|nr:hypothetical protein [Stylosanthes scabra]